jgi:hypothetical protein
VGEILWKSRLPYPTKQIVINGCVVEEYLIPEKEKKSVLENLYPFIPIPSMNAVRTDIHSGKKFRVLEFRVTYEEGMNCLVSPHYEEGGGTVIDWV